ncbi:MAG: hypothetical protein ACSHW4_11920 [Cellulophaga sp.]|uniref:hypothetical protein n=1 Tax=Cellulophaga sp. RHA19 TaxID=1798237 RepID=UPI000C2BB073|nr:hypothetical protein [Cellulophaga sp. RHA19]PKB42450.1 hypothetical protein AX016_0617 [Cellulophaga sp. RHA19]
MKSINIIILFLIILFFSCNQDKTEKDNLINKLHKQTLTNDSLVSVLKEREKKRIILEEKNEYLSMLSGQFSDYFPNKITLFEFIFNRLTKDEDTYRSIASNRDLLLRDASFDISNYNFGFKTYTKEKAFTHIFKTMRRDPEFLKNLLSPEEKKQIFKTIKSSDWYKTSDLDKFLKTLILSYEDIERQNVNGEIYDSIAKPNYDIWAVASDEVQSLLEFDNGKGHTFCCGDILPYSHSFWFRRNSEGNKEVVYELLNQLNDFVITE